MSKFDLIKNLWPEGNRRTVGARTATWRMFAAVEAAAAKRDELSKDYRLTRAGVREQMRAVLKAEVRQSFLEARVALKNANDAVAIARNSIRMPAHDKTDLVSALLRQELRNEWKQLPISDRLKMLVDANADPMLVQAVFELPAAFTGIPAASRDDILQVHLEKAHPAATREVREDTEQLGVMKTAIETVANEIYSMGEFETQVEFKHFVFDQPFERGKPPVALPPLVPEAA